MQDIAGNFQIFEIPNNSLKLNACGIKVNLKCFSFIEHTIKVVLLSTTDP